MGLKRSYQSKRGRAGAWAAAAALILLLAPARARAWGCEGHQAVAMIAEKHLTAHALKMANQLLESQPIDPGLPRFCNAIGMDLMANSSTWADDIRKVRPEASPWHYIDIPRGAPRSAVAASCPAAGCLTSAIPAQMALLRDPATPPRERADALRFIIHFIGDLHQPLHCVTNNDEGGNCVPIDFFGNVPLEKNPQYETYSPNLHAIWDYGIIEHMTGGEPVAQWAAELDRKFAADEPGWEKAGVNIDDWVWESHELADSVVYADLPVPDPVEKPVAIYSCADDNHVSTRLAKLREQVGQSYVDAVAPTIDAQIAKAGVRLAMVLDSIWP